MSGSDRAREVSGSSVDSVDSLDDLREFYADGFSADGGYTYYSLRERRTVTLYGKIPPEAQAAALAIDGPSNFVFSSYYNGTQVFGTPMPFGRYVLEEMPDVFDDIEPITSAEAAREKKKNATNEKKTPSIFGLRPGYGF